MGVHQKIDRVARRHITQLLPEWCNFPSSRQILHFEGNNGPDGIKRKSPAVDEPWHFIDPTDAEDIQLLDTIEQHIDNLADALAQDNLERASFEAAWLAHAITDGLTPAHQYPFEEKLEQIRGESRDTRNSVFKKSVMPGKTIKDLIRNNWEFWGAKGTMTTHFAFEIGVASVVPYQRFLSAMPTQNDLVNLQDNGFRLVYLQCVHQVFDMNMYERFIKDGWTTFLARQTNQELMPIIIKAVVLGWLSAVWLAEDRRED